MSGVAVSARPGRRTLAVLTVAVLAIAGSCKEVSVSAVDVTSVRITASLTQLEVGQSTKFSVRVEDVAGRALRREVVWTSSAPAVATVDTEGLVTARAPGTARITAAAEGRTDETLVTVLPPAVTTVTVVPSIVGLLVGDSAQLRAVAKASDGTELTGRAVSWTTTDGSVATVTPGGLVRALAVGSVTITATIDGVRGLASVSVSGRLLSVDSVRVEPASASIALGDSIRLQAVATASDGSVIPGRRATWTTNASTVAVVDTAGRVRAVGAGTATITATIDGVAGTSVITVLPATLSSISVAPSSTTLALGNIVPLRATVRATDGTIVTGLRVAWASDRPAVASVDTAGTVTALTLGTATITATVAGLSASATIFVVQQPVASITITPIAPALFAGDSLMIDATPRDANGTPLVNRFVAWSTGISSIAIAVPTGPTTQQAWLFGLAAGSTTVSAASEGRTDQTTVTVLPRADLRVTKTAPASVVKAGDTIAFSLLVENRGLSPAASVVVTDTLPAVGTFVDATGSPSQAGNVLTWPTVATLVPGGSVTYTVRVVAPGTGAVTNVGAAVSSTAERDPTDNRSAMTVSVSPADLVVTKSASAAVVKPGDTIVFTVDVSNAGPSDAANVMVTDTLPSNAQFVDATGSPAQASGVLTWQLPTLAVGASVQYTVRVVAPAGGAVRNVAAAVSTSGDANGSDNRAEVTVGVSALANLVVTKTASASAVDAGATIDYTIKVRSVGPSAAASVIVTDTLPANATFVNATGGAVLAGRVLTWPGLASLAAGDSVVYSVRVTAPNLGTVSNVAAATTATAEATPADNVSAVTTTVNGADLGVAKAGPTSVAPGDTLTYSIQVTNGGPGRAVTVVITDTLPPSATFVDAAGGPSHDPAGNVLTWPTLSSLPAGAVVNYTVRVEAPTSGPLVNAAAVTASTGDPNAANNHSVVSTDVAVADVAISKSGPATVNAGDLITYTLDVSNAGPTAATNVVLQDSLPAGVTFIGASVPPVVSGRLLEWTIPTLSSGGAATISVQVQAPVAGGTLTNVALVSSATTDLIPANNRSTAATSVVAIADLAIQKSGPAQASPGETVTYSIDVTNTPGPSAAASVIVTDSLPAGAVFVSATAGGTESNGVVTWIVPGTLLPGGAQSFSVTAQAPAAAGTHTNVARVSASTSDPDPTNNRAEAQTAITLANLSIAKTGPVSATASDTLTYTITVANAGPDAASNVAVTDTLPLNATFQSASPAAGQAGNVLTWNLPSLPSGGNAVFTVKLTGPVAGGTVSNVAAVVSATADPDNLDNVSSTTTAVTPSADLAVTKSGTAQANPGTTISYTIDVTNAGPSAAATVTVTDSLPAGALFQSASGGGTESNGVVTWQLAAGLVSGQGATLTVTALAPPTAGTYTNVARAASTTFDPNTSNDRATAQTIVTQANLNVTKTGPTVATVADTLAYTITVTNTGPSAAADVVVSDTLPSSATFVDATGGVFPSGGALTFPTIPTLAAGGSTSFTVRLMGPVSGGAVMNVAAAVSPTSDPDPGDNRTTITTTVSPAANLQVSKSVSASTVSAADTIAYTVTVTNLGPSDATAVEVADTLPSNGVLVDYTPGASVNGRALTWSAGTLAAGGSATYDVRVLAAASGTVTNVATTTSSTLDPDLSNNVTSVVSTVATVDLDVAVSGPATITAGETITYTVTVGNGGPGRAVGVTVEDQLPANAAFVDASGSYTQNGSVLQWSEPQLESGGALVYTVRVIAPVSGSVQNSASATTSSQDTNPTNDAATATTTVNAAAADVQIQISAASAVAVDDTITYTIDVTNNGPGTAIGVVITQALPTPSRTTFVSATDGIVPTNQTLTWAAVDIAPGAVITKVVKVAADRAATVSSTATASSATSPDPAPGNNSSSATTIIS